MPRLRCVALWSSAPTVMVARSFQEIYAAVSSAVFDDPHAGTQWPQAWQFKDQQPDPDAARWKHDMPCLPDRRILGPPLSLARPLAEQPVSCTCCTDTAPE